MMQLTAKLIINIIERTPLAKFIHLNRDLNPGPSD